MTYFEEVGRWINIPIIESGFEIATLKLDQLIDNGIGYSKPAKAFLDGYINHWLGKMYMKIESRKSIYAQSESEDNYALKVEEELKKIFQDKPSYEANSFDYIILFSAIKSNADQNPFVQKIVNLSKEKNISEENYFYSTNAISDWQRKFEEISYVKLFQLPYEQKYNHDQISTEYLNDLTAYLISHTLQDKERKFLVACEFIKDLKIENKKKYFRSFIRAMFLSYLFIRTTTLQNIFFHFNSTEELNLFNKELIDLIRLIKHHSINNKCDSKQEFFENHPYITEGRLKISELNKEGEVSDTNLTAKEIISTDSLETFNMLQGKVKTKSKAFNKILAQINTIVESDMSVLLLGETGTGKSAIVKQIHDSSLRKGKPYISLNCAAVIEGLIESELFGHIKGSFTGAFEDKTGIFEAANGGTVFLDEIDKASLVLQQKILTFIQTKNFTKVGSTDLIEVDVRIILATNVEPHKLLSSGKMLEDFYHRIAEPSFTITPLRDRKEDIIEFVDLFTTTNEGIFKWSLSLSDEVKIKFQEFKWPGNIRELENLVRKIFILAKSEKKNEFDLDDLEQLLAETPDINQNKIFRSFEESFSDLFANYLNRRKEFKSIPIQTENEVSKKNKRRNPHSFLKLIVEPIAAHHYKASNLINTKASEYLGMEWDNGDDSTLIKRENLYETIAKMYE